VDAVDVAAHRRGRVVVEVGRRAGSPTQTRPSSRGDRAQRADVGAAHVAVAQGAGQRRAARHQVRHVGVQRGPLVERGAAPG
jgi:hypothetical protein